jgi:hypothetical protein
MSAEEATTIISFQAPSQLVQRARELAAANDRSLSGEVRRALETHILLETRPGVEVVRSESRGRGLSSRRGPGEGE